ncbi:Two component regulator propeller [Reichenbachiella faecimaris]|uniref:histidine kinase n=1 Tax=Reichenbachiella faecimaris TaxID=692418 RepID=A0A1W2G949_REIFA|nr:two-component regulator propeller domain-containing protein [Reichenbachiella faecimaris]SMD32826.1 Two component regulator propeller [Reichenbachiella faecimaris]
MGLKKLHLFVWALFVVSHQAAAQQAYDLRFLSDDINDRLPHSDINTIVQDKYGFLWFGTYSGLCRYDGKNIKILKNEFNTSNTLSNSRVMCLEQLTDGSMLIGTEGGGLNHYVPKLETIKTYRRADNQSVSSDVINSIYQTKNGSIWIGTSTGLDLMVIEGDSVYFEKVFSSPYGVFAITEMANGSLLFSSGAEVFEKKKDTKFYSKLINLVSGVNAILSINEQILVGSEIGLHLLTDSGVQTILNYPIIDIFQAHDSTIWLGTRGYGLVEMSHDLHIIREFRANKSDPRSLTLDEVSCIYEDHSGVLWIGTYGGGVNKLDLRAKKFELYTNRPWEENSLSGERVISFYEDSQNLIWIGLRGNGINVMNPSGVIKELSIAKEAPFNGASVSSFYEDPLGGLWVGTWGGGIVVLTPDNKRKLLKGEKPTFLPLLEDYSSVEKIVEDYEGHVWLSSTSGLIQYIPGDNNYYDGKFHAYGSKDDIPITDDFIRDIYVEKGEKDGKKVVWAGTRNGLNRITLENEKYAIKQILSDPNNPSSLPSNFISVIMEDQHGNLWFSGLGGGIAKLLSGSEDPGDLKFKVYSTKDGLPNNEIETILEDDLGNFWMGGYGLTRFDPNNEAIVGFDVNDGLQSNAFKVWSALKLNNGKLIFGGTKGFNVFDPREIRINEIPPKLTLTELKINNESANDLKPIQGHKILDSSVLVTRKIELPYELNSFTISFGALHYTSPENNQLKFKLTGVDSDWLSFQGSETSRNYSKLKPGNYTFTFTGANSDNIWASEDLSFQVTVLKPYWATTYALILYLILLVIVLLIFRRYSIIQVKEMGQIKLERMRRDQKEELNRLKINFYTEVSHELRTPLSLIKGPVTDVMDSTSLNVADRKKLEIVRRNTERMAHLVDEIMIFTEFGKEASILKAAEGNIIKFVKEIQLFFSAEAAGRNIDFRFESDYEEHLIYFDRDKLEKVFFNLLSNAFKFTPQGGMIEIKAQIESNGKIVFSIFNTGNLIPEEDVEHIFQQFYTTKSKDIKGHGIGLSVALQVIKQHDGEIWLENKENGVCFYIALKPGKAHFKPQKLISNFTNSENLPHYVMNDSEIDDQSTSSVKNKTILIVEDNTELREYLIQQLSKHFQVLEAENGKVGLETAIKHLPDVVVSDMMMPIMDGLNMCRQIKSNIHTSHIPVIILTARTSLMQQIDGYDVGADSYVTKPFSTQLLLARINNLISSREKLQNLFKNDLSLSPKEITVTTLDEKILTNTIEIIEKFMEDSDFGVEKLCEEIGMSRSQLYRKIKALTSYSINDFIRLIRLKRAAQLLAQDNSSVSMIMRQVGFENQSYFSRAFKEQFGVSPKQYASK